MHRSGAFSGDVEVTAEAFDQALRLHGVSAGEDQGIGGAEVEDVCEETLVGAE